MKKEEEDEEEEEEEEEEEDEEEVPVDWEGINLLLKELEGNELNDWPQSQRGTLNDFVGQRGWH
jgi:hypothetical protein